MNEPKFSYPKTFLLGFGFFGVSVIWGVYNAFVPLFLAYKFGLSPALIGFFMTLDNIAALLIQPPVGAWSDRIRTPIGRRMPFILIGAPVGALMFGLIPLVAVLPLFVACTSTLLLSMAFWRTPVIALMPDVTPSKYRSQANGAINFMGGIGSIISFLLGAKLYEINPAYPFWLGSALVLTAAALVILFVKEPKVYESRQADRPNLLKSLVTVIKDPDKSALRVLLAILFWFISYSAIEAFFSLYAVNYLGYPETSGTGARLLGQLSLIFVLFAVPSGLIAGRVGRKPTIMTGISLMVIAMFLMFIIPARQLTIPVAKLPALGEVPVVGLVLMLAGLAWSLININSLPMVVDMTTAEKIGTYTGLYYLFSTTAAILGPNINGWVVQLTGSNYRNIMFIGPIFMLLALGMMSGVRRGEAVSQPQVPEWSGSNAGK